VPRFAEANLQAFGDDARRQMLSVCSYVCLWIYEYGIKAGIVIGSPMQKQYAGLSGDSNLYFIGYLQAAAALETLFAQKDKNMSPQLGLIFRRQLIIIRHIVLENRQPILRERLTA
jgi:hypothetical protein